jgi:hypothetical protein
MAVHSAAVASYREQMVQDVTVVSSVVLATTGAQAESGEVSAAPSADGITGVMIVNHGTAFSVSLHADGSQEANKHVVKSKCLGKVM